MAEHAARETQKQRTGVAWAERGGAAKERGSGPAAGLLMGLQRTAGNRAVARLVASRQRLVAARSGLLARALWDGSTTTKAALTQELRDGLELAVRNPANRPNPLPAWVVPRLKADMDYYNELAIKIVDAAEAADAKNGPRWESLPPAAKTARPKPQFLAAERQKDIDKAELDYKREYEGTLADDYKWAAPHDNRDFDLPPKTDRSGIATQGGYTEYYAEPDPAHTGRWGGNRCIRSTAGLWWVTGDHYRTYKQVTDA